MKHVRTLAHLALLILSIASVFVAMSHESAKAANALEFQAGRIIDDAVFTDWQSMNASQIQEFLVAKNSVCLKDFRSLSLVDKNGDGVIQDSTTEQYGPETMSAAELIAAASKTYRINPKVILVTLQKEQGLVTRQDCPSWRYNTALGYGCPDTAPCDEAAFGFTRQIDYGAYHFRGFFDDTLPSVPFGTGTYNISYNPEASCGASPVNIQNRATAALYSYTPYQPNQSALAAGYAEAPPCGAYGNRNFFLYFTDWFGRPAGSSLVRTTQDGTYYLLTNNKRYAIPSGDILYAYGLESTPVEIVGDTFMASIPLGGTLGTLFTIPGNGTVFLADGDKKYGIASGSDCTRWGFSCADPAAVKEIGEEIYFGMTNGGVLHSVASFGNSTYLMEDGKKRIFLSPKAATERGYNIAEAIKLINWTNATRPIGFSFPENGSFVKFGSGPTIYAYSQNNFWSIPDYETFINWYNSQIPSFYDTFSLYNSQPPSTSGSINNIVTLQDGKKYLLDRGKRIDITNVSSNWPNGVSTPFADLLAKIPVTATVPIGQSSIRQADGGIYIVEAQTKRPFNSLRDYFDLGFGALPALQLSTNNLAIPAGTTVFAEGSGYKIAGGDAIFMIGQNNKSYALTSVGQIYAFNMNLTIPTIAPSNASQFAYQGLLTSLVVNANGQHYIVSPKGKIAVSTNDLSRWGISTSNAITLSNRSVDRIPALSVSTVFFASRTGTIYKGENGTKRPIGSFATYRSLGGNDSNTSSIPDDILNAIPTGPVYP